MEELPSAKLAAIGLALPPPPTPAGLYAPAVLENNLVFVSGQIALRDGAPAHPGRVGAEVDPTVARSLAREATLQALSAIASVTGSIDRVRRILRVVVYVAAGPGFYRPHEVANGATELLIELFGENGRPARVAVGVSSLPLNAPVEVELLAATA